MRRERDRRRSEKRDRREDRTGYGRRNRLAGACMAFLLTGFLLVGGCAGTAGTDRGGDGVTESGTEEGAPGKQSPQEEEKGQKSEPISAPESGQAAAGQTVNRGEGSPDRTENDGGQSRDPVSGQPTGADSGQYGGDHTSQSLAVPSLTGALHVEGTQLTGSHGEAVQLRGISTHGLAWFPDYVNSQCFAELRQSWNANVIRLAMYTAEYGGYCNGGDREYLKGLIDDGVAWAREADMYVIIDWHILSDGNPNTHLDEAREFFDEMSALYGEEDHVLYEICNEPNGGTSWSEIKEYAKEIAGVIRANDAEAVILVGTPNWSQYVDEAAADPITEYDNLMYTLHFYAATHRGDLREKMAAAVEAGLPVFVSEYGICDASGNGAVDETEANRWVQAMDAYGISYVAWNLSNKNETSAILLSSCGKTAGFAQDDLSASGRWLYGMLTGGRQPDSGADAQEGESGNGETKSPPLPSPSGQPAESPSQESLPARSSLTNGGFEITAVLTNSWEADGEPVYLYTLSLCNISGSACSQWAVDVAFDGEIALLDGWNGDYSADGSVLHITSKDYNGYMEDGGSVSDIGFIVKGSPMKAE